MNYHMIRTDDMLNGDGLRVVLFVSGCSHNCKMCHNPETWDKNSGIEFDINAEMELMDEISKDYISGITFSGGDPLHESNLDEVMQLCLKIKDTFGDNKTIWLYSGYTWEDIFKLKSDEVFDETKIKRIAIIHECDVFVDGEFDIDKSDVNYPWAGSTNQRVINVPETIKNNKIVLYSN